MIPHLHQSVNLDPGMGVAVNVQGNAVFAYLMDDDNFALWKANHPCQGFGGAFSQSPIRLMPPYAGRWNVVVWLQNQAGSAHVSVQAAHA